MAFTHALYVSLRIIGMFCLIYGAAYFLLDGFEFLFTHFPRATSSVIGAIAAWLLIAALIWGLS